jgi:uncharacterized protein YifE (UPF0438 family)
MEQSLKDKSIKLKAILNELNSPIVENKNRPFSFSKKFDFDITESNIKEKYSITFENKKQLEEFLMSSNNSKESILDNLKNKFTENKIDPNKEFSIKIKV